MDSSQIALYSAGTRGALRGFPAVASPTVRTLAHPVEAVDVTMTVARLEQLFRPADVASVVVLDHDDPGAVGLITRDRFMAVMSGRLGYGRAMLSRKTVAEITDWQPLVVEPDALVSEAAIVAMSRATERRYDDVLVRAHIWAVVPTSDLVRSLSTVLAVRSLHDALTGLANRDLVLRRLRQHCAAVTDTPERVALVLMDVDDLASVNDRHGVETGDLLLAAIATRLTRAAPPLADLGRISGDEFVLVVRLPAAPGPDDARRARADLGARLRACLSEPEPGMPDGGWRTVSTVMSLSEPGFADPDALLREAFASMRARKALVAGREVPEPRVARLIGADVPGRWPMDDAGPQS
ncbi:GGDEF domain-containing protein [Cellulomonas sp. WB94]|uniref:GGDEF domain-containing protein n=1 Tax=Cellulomonas sp. WB94 TaxID=2173174 RepID=UPI001304F6E3|nr:GGDEF domain-containing protein [Cellulomonas sp. WB94]